MTGKVSKSQVPNSPEGEKQGWPVKVVRAGEGGSGFWRVFMDVCREEKNREAGGRVTLTRLLLPFGRLQKKGPRRAEANTKKIRRAEEEKGKGNKNPGGMIFE